jgi:hypothetical protein
MNFTPYTFPGEIWKLLQNVPYFKGDHESHRIEFTEEYPKANTQGPVITWRIYRRFPGRGPLERLGPRPRGQGTIEGDLWETWGQWMTAIYQFDCFHITNREANELAWNFEEAMFTLLGELVSLPGIEKIFFDEQVQDSKFDSNDSLNVRSLRYQVFFDVHHKQQLSVIDSIRTTLYEDLRIKGDLEITRSTKTYDILPIDRLQQIIYVWKEISDTQRAEYISGVDYKLLQTDSKEYILDWVEKGAKPLAGEVYKVSYSSYQNQTTYRMA